MSWLGCDDCGLTIFYRGYGGCPQRCDGCRASRRRSGPRSTDLACAACGGRMGRVRSSKPQGEAICLPCRRAGAYRPQVVAPPWQPEIVPCPACGGLFAQGRPGQVYCDAECRKVGRREGRRGHWPNKGSTTERGYGVEHQRLRRALLPTAYGHRCPICFEEMTEAQDLHLDHSVPLAFGLGLPADRIVHAWCNESQGQRIRLEAARRV